MGGSVEAQFERSLSDPLLTVGDDPTRSGELLGRIVGVARLPSGAWATADGQNRRVLVVGPDGDSVQVLGGEGEGPGEFRSIGAGGVWSSTTGLLGVWDPRQGRITMVDPEDGSVARTIPIQQDSPAGRPDLFVAELPSGGFLLASTDVGGRLEGDESIPDRHRIGLFGPGGNFVRQIGEFPGFVRGSVEVGGRQLTGPVTFSPVPMTVRGPDGLAGVTNGAGGTVALFPTPDRTETIAVTPGESGLGLAEAWEALDRAAASADFSDLWSARVEAEQRDRGELPRIGAMLGSRDHLWVQLYEVARHAMPLRSGTRPAPGGVWRLHAWSGEHVGDVALPPDFVPITVSGDLVGGVVVADLGSEHFEVRRITPPAPPPSEAR